MLHLRPAIGPWFVLYCACVVVSVSDAHFNLFMNESETRRLLGIPGDLYYVKDGIINEYALTFNIPIKSNIDEIFFNWQSVRSNPAVRYSISINVSAAGIINLPVLSVDKEGNVPTKPSMFSLTLACTGTTSADVDIKLQLNATVVSASNVTTLDIKRKKTCIRESRSATEQVEVIEPVEDVGNEQSDDRSTSILTAAERGLQSLTSGNNVIYVGISGACVVAVIIVVALLARRFCRSSASGKTTTTTRYGSGCERPLAPHPYQLTIKSQFRSETPTSNSIISGIGSIHRGMSYVIYSELKPTDVDDLLRDIHVDCACVTLSDLLLEGSFGRVYRGALKTGPNYGDCQPVIVKTVNERARKDQAQTMLREACLTKGAVNANVAAITAVSLQETENHLVPLVMYAVDGVDCHNLKTFLHRCRIAEINKSADPMGTTGGMRGGSVIYDEMQLMSLGQTSIPVDRMYIELYNDVFCLLLQQMLGVPHQVYAALQINSALQYLHRRRVVHRDVAARNCLVDGQLRVRLTDGALSRDIFPHDYQLMCLSDCDTRPVKWMSPEVLVERRYSAASDMWSFAVLVWELFTFAEQPYFDIEVTEMVDHLTQGYRLAQPANCPDDIYQTLICCWNVTPEDRPRFTQMHVCLQEAYVALTRFV